MNPASFTFAVESAVASAAPAYSLLAIEACVVNGPTTDALWALTTAAAASAAAAYRMEEIRLRPAIDATRRAYKALGKEPNRYRPSAEALSRRAVKGMELYRTLAVIDLINLVSLKTGISIGGFDADRIEGTHLSYGRGEAGEPYEAIGRGPLNIEGLPVWRDAFGGIGTPTSDNERTKLSESTRRVLLTVNFFHEATDDERLAVGADLVRLLEEFAQATDIRCAVVKP